MALSDLLKIVSLLNLWLCEQRFSMLSTRPLLYSIPILYCITVSSYRARPKSPTLISAFAPTKQFLAAKSRWMNFCFSKYSMPEQTCKKCEKSYQKRASGRTAIDREKWRDKDEGRWAKRNIAGIEPSTVLKITGHVLAHAWGTCWSLRFSFQMRKWSMLFSR